MKAIFAFLINGFLFSITPSAVTESKCVNPSPVVTLQICPDEKEATPVNEPQQPAATPATEKQDDGNKQALQEECPAGKAC